MSVHPIATAPKDGRVILVGKPDGNIAICFWSGSMWAFCAPEGTGDALLHQVHFEPTLWSHDYNALAAALTGKPG